MDERQNLEQAIASLEAQRTLLGSAVVDAGVAALREKIQALQAASTQPVRKQTTILFADIADFTRLSAGSDAEDVTDLTNLIWQMVDHTILAYGGQIDKHIGDAVMAIWGSDQAREDDAERAIRAALSIQGSIRSGTLFAPEAVQALRAEKPAVAALLSRLPARWLRIGIHSGPVFLSAVGISGEFTAIGDTVNTANRIQHLTQPGQVIISADTYQRVRGLFRVQALEPLVLKGKAEALPAYEVVTVKPRLFRPATRGIDGIETSMVGRDADLKTLQDALRATLADQTSRLVSVIGEAGLGKSRLVYEFENWAELLPQTIRHYKGRASPEMQNQPYSLLRDVFSNRFAIQENDSSPVVCAKFEQGIGEWLSQAEDGQMKAHMIGQLLGFDFHGSPYIQGFIEPRQLRSRALLYLNDYFTAIMGAHPMALILEDIHWADHSSLEAVEVLSLALAQRPLLVVCLARPTLFERRPQWTQGLPNTQVLNLNPLADEESRQLTCQLLNKAAEIPPTLVEMITSESEGIPYYIEEFIRMLIDDGVIHTTQEPWQIEVEQLNRLHIPATLTGVIQARLDSLTDEERLVLQQASVVGRNFWDAAILKLGPTANPNQPHHELETTLDALRRRSLIFELRNSSFHGAREFIFKHALLRQVTYESVLKRDRRRYHTQIAAWLIQHSQDRGVEFASLIGEHLDLAGSASEAAVYLRQAGEQAAQQFDSLHALSFFDRAFALAGTDDVEARYAILAGREQVLDWLGRREVQLKDLQGMENLLAGPWLEPAQQTCRRAQLYIRFSNYYEVTSDYPQAIASARQAVEQAERSGDLALMCASYYRLGRASWRQGDNVDGLAATEQALELARQAGQRQIQAHALRQIGAIAFHQGDYGRLLPAYQEALEIYQAIGDRAGASSTLNNLGDAQRRLGYYDQARQYFEQSRQNSRSIGESWSESIGLANLAQMSIIQGNYATGLQEVQQALELARSIDQRSIVALNQANIGRALVGLGRLGEALEAYQESVSMRQILGQRHLEAESLAQLAYVYLLLGQLDQAQKTVAKVLNFLETNTMEGVEEPFLDCLYCYQVLKANYDPGAGRLLDDIYRALQQEAANITDPTYRASFLNNVSVHAEIVREWQAKSSSC